MKAIILARVSTEEQKEAGNSLPAQVERQKKYCKQKGFEILKIYSFDESAYKIKRDAFDKILDYLKNSKEKIAVCFDKVDRFSRNVFDKRVAYLYELTMKDKIELHFSSDNLVITPDISAVEKFHFNMNLGLAKYYSDAISDNVKRASETKIRNGEWPGKAPIGYKNYLDEKGNKQIEVDTTRSESVVKMFELYSTGNYSLGKITAEMKKIGLTSNTIAPRQLRVGTIYTVLTNPFYYGIMRTKRGLHPHKYPHLISKELFDKVQEVRSSWHKKPFKYASKPYIFRGMIKCAECGCIITPETKKGHNYYSCTNYKKMHPKRIYIREENLLAPILDVLKKIQLPDEKIKQITNDLKNTEDAKNDFHKQAITTLRKEYDRLDKMSSKAFDLLADESITKDLFNQKLKEYKEKQAEIQERLRQYTDADESFYLTASMVLSLAQRALKIFESSKIPEKRQLLNYLLQNCELKQKKLTYTLKNPFDKLLLAHQALQQKTRHSTLFSELPGRDSNSRPTR